METIYTLHLRKLTQDVPIPDALRDKRQTRSWVAYDKIPAGTEVIAFRSRDNPKMLLVHVDPGMTNDRGYVADGLQMSVWTGDARSEDASHLLGWRILENSEVVTDTLRAVILSTYGSDCERRHTGDRTCAVLLYALWRSGMLTKEMIAVAVERLNKEAAEEAASEEQQRKEKV